MQKKPIIQMNHHERLCRPWMRSHAEALIALEIILLHSCQSWEKETHLLIRVHAGKSPRVAGLTTLAGDLRNLFLGPIGEVARVGVGGAAGLVVFVILWCFCVREIGEAYYFCRSTRR